MWEYLCMTDMRICISHALTRKDTHIREPRRDTITPCVAFILWMHLVCYRKACHLNGDPADQRWQPLAIVRRLASDAEKRKTPSYHTGAASTIQSQTGLLHLWAP